MFFEKELLDPAAALNITNRFTVQESDGTAPAGVGLDVQISGGALTTGNDVFIDISGDVTMTMAPGASFDSGRLILTNARQFTSTGKITSASLALIDAPNGISITDLAAGGQARLLAANGPVIVGDLRSAGLVTALGQSIDIRSLAGLSFADLDATGGDLLVQTASNLDAATVDATGAIALTSINGAVHTTGAVNSDGIDISANGNVDTDAALTSTDALSVTAGGAFTAGAAVTATGDVARDAATGIAAPNVTSGGTTLLRALNGPILIGNLLSADLVTALARSVDITSAGGLSFADLDATAGGIEVETAGDLAAATVDATGAITLTSTGGAVHTTGAVNGAGIDISANGNVDTDAAVASTDALSVTAGGTFTAGAAVTATGNVAIDGTGGISATNVTSGGTTLLQAANGPIVIGNLLSADLVTALARSIDITSSGGLTFADLDATAGNIDVETADDLDTVTVDATGAVTLISSGGAIRTTGAVNGAGIDLDADGDVQVGANATSSAGLNIRSGGTFGLSAIGTGTDIAIESLDIDLAAAAQLGTRGTTQTIALTNADPASQTSLGGDGSAAGFNLDEDEASRLFADQEITLTAPRDAVVGDLALTFGANGNIGTGGTLKLNAPGFVEVNGAVDLTTSSIDDTFSIDPEEIFVNGESGSIFMHDDAGALGGTLNLVAETIMAATPDVKAAVDAVDPIDQVSAILDQPSAVPSDGGTIQAANIFAEVTSGIFIQNTGTGTAFADRRDFTANSLFITTNFPDDQIAINGVIIDATGQRVTGLATTALVTINDIPAAAGGQFDALSTINGCVIGANCATPGLVPPDKTEIIGTLKPPGFVFRQFTLIEADESDPSNLLPLIDEPVTGVGNDDLWQGACGPEAAGCAKE